VPFPSSLFFLPFLFFSDGLEFLSLFFLGKVRVCLDAVQEFFEEVEQDQKTEARIHYSSAERCWFFRYHGPPNARSLAQFLSEYRSLQTIILSFKTLVQGSGRNSTFEKNFRKNFISSRHLCLDYKDDEEGPFLVKFEAREEKLTIHFPTCSLVEQFLSQSLSKLGSISLTLKVSTNKLSFTLICLALLFFFFRLCFNLVFFLF
jgi:hypothetical protein